MQNEPAIHVSYAEIVSSLALLISAIALIWNVAKYFIQERVSVDFTVAFGEMGNGMFADAGSLLPDHKFDNPLMLVQVINTGRKPIVIAKAGGKLKNGKGVAMKVEGLPKMLQPYEIFHTVSPHIESLLQRIKNNELEDLWVIDSKGEKWPLSKRGRERLNETASYILSNKHL